MPIDRRQRELLCETKRDPLLQHLAEALQAGFLGEAIGPDAGKLGDLGVPDPVTGEEFAPGTIHRRVDICCEHNTPAISLRTGVADSRCRSAVLMLPAQVPARHLRIAGLGGEWSCCGDTGRDRG